MTDLKLGEFNKRIFIITFVILIIGLYLFDPPLKRTIEFEGYKVEYEWRLFNNLYCNSKTAGHCHTNETNKINAEVKFYQQLLAGYNGQGKIKKKLIDAVGTTVRFRMRYIEITKSTPIKIDSLLKYKDEIFRPILLK